MKMKMSKRGAKRDGDADKVVTLVWFVWCMLNRSSSGVSLEVTIRGAYR